MTTTTLLKSMQVEESVVYGMIRFKTSIDPDLRILQNQNE